jgi:undecaprenyl pyrophosphate synthase
LPLRDAIEMNEHHQSAAWLQARAQVPRHVAIIMDGNGRWAQARGLPRSAGHRKGVEAVRRTVRAAIEIGVQYLTIFSFSSENWRGRQRDRRSDGADEAVRAARSGRAASNSCACA